MDTEYIDAVLSHYIRTALWSQTDESDDSGGEPLDANWGPEDLTAEAVAEMRADVADFLDCIERSRPTVFDEMKFTLWADPGQVGHDFWLTRNGHGAGFWDRYSGGHPAEPLGDYLTAWSKPYGDAHLYVGDDRRIHYSNG
jgi:hypothetical protein